MPSMTLETKTLNEEPQIHRTKNFMSHSKSSRPQTLNTEHKITQTQPYEKKPFKNSVISHSQHRPQNNMHLNIRECSASSQLNTYLQILVIQFGTQALSKFIDLILRMRSHKYLTNIWDSNLGPQVFSKFRELTSFKNNLYMSYNH